MLPCKIIPFFLAFLSFTSGITIQDLGGSWNVVDVAGTYSFQGTVPGGIYSDLMDNKIIGDVFYGTNDVETRWVSKTNWTYSRQISVDEALYSNKVINLVFDGIDTFAEIRINDVFVGTTENMFVQYIFNVKSYIEVGENTISINFLSPVEKAALLYNIQAQDYAVPPSCVPDNYNGECHSNHIRKMQASFSWDWGPAFPSVGIWKPVYLEAYHQSVIRYVTFKTEDNSDSWLVTATVYMSDPPTPETITGTLSLTLQTDLQTVIHINDVEIHANSDDEYISVQSFTIPKSYVSLWWPNGYGNAHLYQMDVIFETTEKVSSKVYNIGFRTVELVQEDVESGASFYFKVNNVPIFAKGTNSIPINILPEKGQNPDTVRFLLQSAKDVHMNMIRVWGGGTYESDLFYELSDQMGILIWQDFMFACAMYPVNEDFLSTVKDEVRHQVRRLQHHPSIILWAGNNENEAALRQNWYGTASNFDQFKEDFKTLYVNTVRAETLASDSTRPFLTSSPTNGIESERDDYVAPDPQSEMYGDVHYYNYLANPWTKSYFPVPRFSSEYGLQSLPSLSSWLTVTNDTSDLAFNSEFMAHRQHHPLGNAEMYALTLLQMELPTIGADNFYKAFIFYTQIIQAMGMKQQTEYYRLWRSITDDIGRGLTMGALYWQLNDVWVAPTWSGIDFNNNWKMLHYFAKHFFAPVIVTTNLQTDRTLEVYVVSDLMTNSYNNSLTISVYSWNDTKPIYTQVMNVDVLSGHSKQVYTTWADQYLEDAGCDDIEPLINCFFTFSLTSNGDEIAPVNFVFPSSLKISNIKAATVKIGDVKQLDTEGRLFEVTVETDNIALFVWLETGNIRGLFSDNGFLLVTNTMTVTFTAEDSTTVSDLSAVLTVTHLQDPQYWI